MTAAGPPLSSFIRDRLEASFPVGERRTAERVLVDECGSNLPFCEGATAAELDRIRCAAVKSSGGTLHGLQEAVALAKVDWRDLLMVAGFGEDVSAHRRWWPDADRADVP